MKNIALKYSLKEKWECCCADVTKAIYSNTEDVFSQYDTEVETVSRKLRVEVYSLQKG